mmetsp:Transcript_36215/g.82545  ORF Transcript_36215/g.82545 Transcript_36215/m.82545 type:complete len:425 (+) Transcript_36215:35-1309(+)|eukprot:CAMPEP_0114559324 /NCGR_PEP_ID=MMETSP0114-20121206/10863_1 /TAXON_ID=31324 /ORGANISM="Goniomonas sp, Strain m" /LENGTH=424 /DNA_ID=CAMNT_0001744791 /DNA_START=22 /DNA_END=1296 /DNA_ORIENTATION=-
MRLTVTDARGEVFLVEVDPDQTLEDVKAVLEVEAQIPIGQQEIYHNSKLVTGHKVSDCGFSNDDMLFVQRITRPFNPKDPLSVRDALRADPAQMAQLRHNNPELAAAAASEDPSVFTRMWLELQRKKEQAEEEAMIRRARLAVDPLDPMAQMEIEKELRTEQINENMEVAMEYNPEVFGSVIMLYVNCEVNGRPLKAFVDSGAQMTIMSQQCAERCGLVHLIDKRWQGVAKGVGTSKIIGRVHSAPMTIGGQFLHISLTVLEDDSMEFLFGLDNLRRHQCCIDLSANVLRFGEASVPFLQEHELPAQHRGGGAAATADDDGWEGVPPEALAGGDAARAPSGTGAAPPQKQARTEPVPPATAPAAAIPVNTPATNPVPAAPAATPAVDMEKVSRLQALGFPQDQAIAALNAAGGNEDMAAGFLFG